MCKKENETIDYTDSKCKEVAYTRNYQFCSYNKKDCTLCYDRVNQKIHQFGSLFAVGFIFNFLWKIFVDEVGPKAISSFYWGPFL